jgi:hypothetical protein
VTRIIMDRLLSSIGRIEGQNPYLNRFTDKEGARLLSSVCGMLEVPKNVVGDYILEQESSLDDVSWLSKQAPMREGPESYFNKGIMYSNSRKKAIRISNRILSILHEMLKKSS